MNSGSDSRLASEDFPRSTAYHPDWVIEGSMGSNVLWLTEWLTGSMNLSSGMRVLDLGCGRGLSSVFLAREYGVDVWATDLWISATENSRRFDEAGVGDQVFPLHCDARALPYASDFFDAIVCVDAFSYFGTDDLYLNYLANFVKPSGQIGIAGAGLMSEIEVIPDHLRAMWTQDFWCLHSANWWERHWGRSGILDLEIADSMPEGWQKWLNWHQTAHPDNEPEINAVQADAGRYLGYVRTIGRRREDAQLVDYCWPDALRSFPAAYEKKPLLRDA